MSTARCAWRVARGELRGLHVCAASVGNPTRTNAFFKASAGLSWNSGCSERILGKFSMTNWEAFSPCLPWPDEGQAAGTRLGARGTSLCYAGVSDSQSDSIAGSPSKHPMRPTLLSPMYGYTVSGRSCDGHRTTGSTFDIKWAEMQSRA